MNRNKLLILLLLCAFLLLGISSVHAGDLTPGYLYRNTPDPDFPKTLYVGWVQKCGRYTIRLLQDPVVTKSNQYMVSDADTKYLVLRVAIVNNSDEPGGWLTPDSFVLQDTYRGRAYGTYILDIADSAKVAWGFKQEVFHAAIKPRDTLYTTLVFSVYPDVKSWLLTFAPHSFGEEPEAVVRFQLPLAVFQETLPVREEEE